MSKENNCICKTCNTEFYVTKGRKEKGQGIYCSWACFRNRGYGQRYAKSPTEDNCKCIICDKTFYLIQSHVDRGQGKYCSTKCKYIGISLANKQSKCKKGIRYYPAYLQWRKDVFTRDNYTCQHCQKRGVKINAHHIIPLSKDMSLSLDITNGITLCIGCHAVEHKRLRLISKHQTDLFVNN